MTGVLETAAARVHRLAEHDPFLTALRHAGVINETESDTLTIAAESDYAGRPFRIAYPGETARLATTFAFLLAFNSIIRPRPDRAGPIAIVGGTGVRAVLDTAQHLDQHVAKAFRTVRLRADGLVQPLNGGPIRELSMSDRLVLVSVRASWPKLEHPIASAVLDERTLLTGFDDAHAWALDVAGIVHVVSTLDPQRTPSGYELDWPFLRAPATSEFGVPCKSWPYRGDVQIVDVGPGPQGLSESRQRIGRAGGRSPWPAPVQNAAALTRAIVAAAVPPTMLDAHRRGSFMPSFADRLDDLESARAASLPPNWKVFAETEWASLRHELRTAAAELEERNLKAEQIGFTIESLIRAGETVDVWVDTRTHARALTSHLLSSGFSLTVDDFERSALRVRAFGEMTGQPATASATVLTALPNPWHLDALLSWQVAGPLTILCYSFEAERVSRYLGWALNAGRAERASARGEALLRSVGRVELPECPSPVTLNISGQHIVQPVPASPVEPGGDAAEYAALADDEWLALLNQETTPADSATSHEPTPARAFLVDNDMVLLLQRSGTVDRLTGRRLLPAPVASLNTGMQILSGARNGFFRALRPHLDRIRGAGTTFWLEQWETAFAAAVARTGDPRKLSSALQRAGAEISAQAVGSWASPYRIGPRDWHNVALVGDIADKPVVRLHAARIGAVMRGLRIEHSRLGRQLAAAVRRHVSNDPGAFDIVENALGISIDELLGPIELLTIRQVLGDGVANRNNLGRTWTVRQAHDVFTPDGGLT